MLLSKFKYFGVKGDADIGMKSLQGTHRNILSFIDYASEIGEYLKIVDL